MNGVVRFDKPPNPYIGYITNVYTHPATRNQGIGSKIFTAMERWSKEKGVDLCY
ncbi:N-acetyltransferase [Paenibacillus sp. L3-i20]|uniref:GNAT family N-acetyltransferase n=1 Tax=Paenibacillus sp. L3-i20 TaxID=2905833 RepID=UPI0024A72D55|nr:GNAT family N-acetyltransferase [Paenibacillus sp. L3-i20]